MRSRGALLGVAGLPKLMRTLCLSLILVSVPIVGVAGGQSPSTDDPAAMLKALESGLVKVKDASRSLARERALATKRGVPARVEALIPALRSEADNAAPIYR